MIALATLDARLPRHVLSPVLALIRLHLLPDSELEVFVRNLAVFIGVKKVEQFRELVLGRRHAPVGKVELEVLGHNGPTLSHIHINEGLAHGFPLLVYLHHHLLNQVLVERLLALVQVFLRILHLEALRIEVERWIDSL